MIPLTIWDLASSSVGPFTFAQKAHPQERDFHGYECLPRTGFISHAAPPAMLIERRGTSVVVWAPAKVNLFLEVLARRPDSYHEIATLMVAVSLYDTLECTLAPDENLELTCDNEELSVGPDNLILRAAELLRLHSGMKRGARLRLSKRIPMAAGLAGGSTDAAAALAGLNLLWDLGQTASQLANLGGQVGSDVPFFFHTPAAWCTGRGEKVRPVGLSSPLWLVLVCPAVGLSTAEVYGKGQVPGVPVDGAGIREALAAGDSQKLGSLLHNRLQETADRLRPELVLVRERLRRTGPAGCLMSGSGTSCFALCRDEKEALDVVQSLRPEVGQTEIGRVYVVRSCL
jgi:4-diphosphocytidyl-2-C-methyl-D-erythritol kinase